MRSMSTRRQFIRQVVGGSAALASGFLWPPALAGQEQPPAGRPPVKQPTVIRVTASDVMDAYGRVDRESLTGVFDRAMKAVSGMTALDAVIRQYVSLTDRVGLLVNRAWGVQTSIDFAALVLRSVNWSGVPEESIALWEGGAARYDDTGLARSFLDHCDVIFSLPTLYTHWKLGMSGALANILGICRDPERYYRSHGRGIGELWALPEFKQKHKLVIMDALRPYCGPGPAYDPAYRWPQQTSIVSEDPVAVDVVAREILTQRRQFVRGRDWPLDYRADYIEEADTTYGVGVSDPDNIKRSDIWI